jgi:hypothetical protein
MPIYQRPTQNIGSNRTIGGRITDANGDPVEHVVVVLRRRGSGDVAYADTNAQGQYEFTIEGDGDFDVAYSLSQDPAQALVTQQDIAPSVEYQWYQQGVATDFWYNGGRNSILRNNSSLLSINGFPLNYDIRPGSNFRAEVVDTVSATPTDAFSGYYYQVTEGGTGEGAEVEVGFANEGDYRSSSGGNPTTYTAQDVALGNYINKLTIKAVGRNYKNALLKISGYRVSYTPIAIINEDGSYTFYNGQDSRDQYDYLKEYDGVLYGYSRYEFNGEDEYLVQYSGLYLFSVAGYIESYPTTYQSEIQALIDFQLGDGINGYTLGNWTGTNTNGDKVQGDRLLASALPGLRNDRSDFSPTVHNITDWITGMTDVDVQKEFGEQIYYRVIYGTGGTDDNPTADSAVLKLTGAETDLLKGWFSKYYWIPGFASATGINFDRAFKLGVYGYQAVDAVIKAFDTIGNADSPLLSTFTITQPFLQNYGTGNATYRQVITKIVNEFRQAARQVSGGNIPESSYATVIYPLLQKAGINSFIGTDSNGVTRTYTFGPTSITY